MLITDLLSSDGKLSFNQDVFIKIHEQQEENSLLSEWLKINISKPLKKNHLQPDMLL